MADPTHSSRSHPDNVIPVGPRELLAQDLPADELRRAVAGIRWRHTIDVGQGVVTPGEGGNRVTLARLGLPQRLEGLSVLDVGASDGFFSFEAERRGAQRVLAIDTFCSWGTRQGFDLARRALRSRVQDRQIDVLDLSPDTVGVFDLVLFLGVLYHLRHPLLALERIISVTGSQLILETHVDLLHCRRPAVAVYPWGCGPNTAAVIAMLRSVGFRRVAIVSQDSLPYRVARAVKRLVQRRPGSFLSAIDQGRLVVHAWR
jgi:tRNA (mo5U34)-methyltransferase